MGRILLRKTTVPGRVVTPQPGGITKQSWQALCGQLADKALRGYTPLTARLGGVIASELCGQGYDVLAQLGVVPSAQPYYRPPRQRVVWYDPGQPGVRPPTVVTEPEPPPPPRQDVPQTPQSQPPPANPPPPPTPRQPSLVIPQPVSRPIPPGSVYDPGQPSGVPDPGYQPWYEVPSQPRTAEVPQAPSSGPRQLGGQNSVGQQPYIDPNPQRPSNLGTGTGQTPVYPVPQQGGRTDVPQDTTRLGGQNPDNNLSPSPVSPGVSFSPGPRVVGTRPDDYVIGNPLGGPTGGSGFSFDLEGGLSILNPIALINDIASILGFGQTKIDAQKNAIQKFSSPIWRAYADYRGLPLRDSHFLQFRSGGVKRELDKRPDLAAAKQWIMTTYSSRIVDKFFRGDKTGLVERYTNQVLANAAINGWGLNDLTNLLGALAEAPIPESRAMAPRNVPRGTIERRSAAVVRPPYVGTPDVRREYQPVPRRRYQGEPEPRLNL